MALRWSPDRLAASCSRFSLIRGGNVLTYSDDLGGALLGSFLSGDTDRGGVLALDARRPRNVNRLKITSFCR